MMRHRAAASATRDIVNETSEGVRGWVDAWGGAEGGARVAQG